MTEKKKQKKKQKTENRDKTEFIGPIPPVGVGPKIKNKSNEASFSRYMQSMGDSGH